MTEILHTNKCKTTIVVLLFIFQLTMHAQLLDSVSVDSFSRGNDIEISGLLFDETITKVGKDFYDMFYNKWQFPETNESFFITFSERPMPGLGTRVTITIDDTQIFQQFVKPNYEQMELLSDYAVQILNNYIVDYEKIKKQLDQGDQTGSGIF
ncbi:MAG: CsgE family curli-type amyloid fiber assembly protein [bacterium]